MFGDGSLSRGFCWRSYGQLRLVLTAFGESTLRGIMCLAVPGYVVFYAWREERRKLAIWLGGVALVVLGMVLAP